MSLYTGKRINSYVWEELPISDEVKERVEELAEQQKQPKFTDGMPTFDWISNVERVRNTNADDNRANDDDEDSQSVDSEDIESNDESEDDNNQNPQVTDEEDESDSEEESLQLDQVREYSEDEQTIDNEDGEDNKIIWR